MSFQQAEMLSGVTDIALSGNVVLTSVVGKF